MTDMLELETLGKSFDSLGKDAEIYFDQAEAVLQNVRHPDRWNVPARDHFWAELSPQARGNARDLAKRLLVLAGYLVNAVQTAPLASEADQRDVMTGTKTMRAALLLREFQSWPTDVLHDEGTVLGVQPPGQSDDAPNPPESARRSFADWMGKLRSILDLVVASRELGPAGRDVTSVFPTRYRPGTAFIMMSMDRELIDLSDTIKRVFEQFEIVALRADDIEHEGLITTRILSEIETSEFLFADLTYERPNVYYEVGYAHALKRRVILFRKAGTGLHFDLAGYNCPEYENHRDLREKLNRRLEYLMNRSPKTAV